MAVDATGIVERATDLPWCHSLDNSLAATIFERASNGRGSSRIEGETAGRAMRRTQGVLVDPQFLRVPLRTLDAGKEIRYSFAQAAGATAAGIDGERTCTRTHSATTDHREAEACTKARTP